MQTPLAADLLNTWDWGQHQSPLERALRLLAAAHPHASVDTLAELTVGQRDTKLLALRESLFGPHLTGLVNCPACGELLELNFTVMDVIGASVSGSVPEQALTGEGAEALSLSVGGYEVLFRLADSRDLQAVSAVEEAPAARRQLLQRCIISIESEGESRTAGELPQEIIAAIEERMAAADPQADLQLSLSCIACTHSWQTAFDIVSFLWSELDNWAHRTLHDVHLLASAYGWSEAETLALSPWRRRLYIDKIDG